MDNVEIQVVQGPILTDLRGQLKSPVALCRTDGKRCVHSGLNDYHYFYCAGQPVANQTYPWPGAGTHLFRGPYPNKGCPLQAGKENDRG